VGGVAFEYGVKTGHVVEDRHVVGFHGGGAFSEVNLDPVARNFDGPEQARRRERRRIQVVDLRARTGLIHIHSDEGKGPPVELPVGAPEVAFHETHIVIHERQRTYLTGRHVGSRHRTADVR
jgi:hypothetical protein